jgi:probable addiction module antidote protein
VGKGVSCAVPTIEAWWARHRPPYEALLDEISVVAYKLRMPSVKTKPFDAAEVLDSPEMIAAYLTEAFGSDDPALMAMAIGAVARSQGMSAVAEKAGLSRENLYRALGGDAKPEFGTVIKVLHALGIDLIAQPKAEEAA